MEREELIQSARKLYNSPWPNDALKKALEENYPELKESEDEQIRKDLIGGLMWQRDNLKSEGPHDNNLILPGFCLTVGEHLAYLEKQKENPKSVDYIPSDCASSAKCENEHNKPGDFVFELRQIISRHWYADMYSECVDDEEGMAREILSLCEKQKEQKPAEYSEEDEKMLVGIIERGSAQIPPHEPALREEQMEWLMNRLKTLRPKPHWKPSEEQMNALNGVANDGVLLDLFNDLLKLL